LVPDVSAELARELRHRADLDDEELRGSTSSFVEST
jgi:hypothetical protein